MKSFFHDLAPEGWAGTVSRAHASMSRAVRFRLATSRFLPGALASMLAGVRSGAILVDADRSRPRPGS